MSWGDASIYVWGGFEWGFTDPTRYEQFFADAVLQLDDNDISYSADAILAALIDTSFSGDAVLQGTLNSSFGADALVARLPSEDYKKRAVAPILLIELRLPTGDIRVSSTREIHDGKAWSPRLKNAGEIERSAGQKQDDIRIILDDTDDHGPIISDLISDTDPAAGSEVSVFLGLRDRPVGDRIHLFEGRIEQVVGVSETEIEFEVVRQDAVDDIEIGRVVTGADFPDAPDDSLGSIIPIVFGVVDRHEGIVTNFNARTTLDLALQIGDAVAILQDGASFPASGTAKIDDEIITWASKTGDNQLNGLTRSVSGTQEDDHAEGAEIIEEGDFVVKFADHSLDSLGTFRIPDERGNLVEATPAPVIDAPNALATWPETPRIKVPTRAIEYIRAGFASDSGSTGDNPLLAAREAIGFSELGTADVGPGEQVTLARAIDLGEPGQITRVFAVVVYDPTGFGLAGTQVRIPGLSIDLGSLNGVDNTPTKIAQRDYKTGGLTHDVVDPTHAHAAITKSILVTPRNIVSALNWLFTAGAIDNNAATATTNNSGSSILELNNAFIGLGSGQTVLNWKLRVVMGNQGSGVDIFPSVYEFRQQGFFPTVFVVNNQSSNNQVLETALQAGSTLNIGQIAQARWRVIPASPGLSRDVNVRTMELEVTISEQNAAAATSLAQNRGVAQYFDVTNLVNNDWSFFTDVTRGDRLRVSNGTGTLRVLNMYYLIEFNPFSSSAGQVPRVFANCTGLVPDGDPIDVIDAIITTPSPVGLGLTGASIDRGSYNAAQDLLDADSMRADFSISRPTSAIKVISELADNMGLREFWDQAIHNLVRKPDPASLPAVFRTFKENDVVIGSISRGRLDIEDVVNLLQFWFKPDDFLRDFRGGDSQTLAPVGNLGVRKKTKDFFAIRDLPTVQVEAARILSRNSVTRWLVTFSLYLGGVELRRGDIISLAHREFGFAKAEVVGINLNAVNRPLTIKVDAIVWQE